MTTLCCRFACLVAFCLPSLSLFAAETNTLTPEELSEGWVQLFDGETLFGWKTPADASWKVADGVIAADEAADSLVSTSQFGNFVLSLQVQAAAESDASLYLRSTPKPTEKKGGSYEVSLSGGDKATWPLGSIIGQAKAKPAATEGWQTVEITADAGRLAVQVDGKPAAEWTDPKPLGRGFLVVASRKGKISLRNVKLRPLDTEPLFDSKSLAGWKPTPENKSVFTVTPEGWLHVKNGKGSLETEGEYGDFTLQFEVFVGGKALNSGVFYRCIPGEVMNGYECQIQNGFQEGDRTKPQDCGTGGIFRRQDARKVMSNDFEWFPMTIHADGNHVATWVCGVQVADWTDTRSPHANPRNGRRLEPGTIQLQGHDATTDLSFRNLRIAPLPPRSKK